MQTDVFIFCAVNKVFRKEVLFFVGSISFASLINICFAAFLSKKKKGLDCAFKILPRCTNQLQEMILNFFFKIWAQCLLSALRNGTCNPSFASQSGASQFLAVGREAVGKEKRSASLGQEARRLCSTHGCYSGGEGQGEGN